MWYVSRQGRGFTDDPDKAAHDSKGCPVPAQGYLAAFMKRMEKQYKREANQYKRSLRQLWESLLDEMEALDDLLGAKERKEGLPQEQHDRELAIHDKQIFIDGLCSALAVIEHLEEWKANPQEAIALVERKAESLFEVEDGNDS